MINITSSIKKEIMAFLNQRSIEHRYASYDFCYLYFQRNKGKLSKDMEKSCFILWGYLASWGMLRGSSDLLKCSPAILKLLITYFDQLANPNHPNHDIWDIDVPDYGNPIKVQIILDVHDEIKKILRSKGITPTVTLVTKIMLGVFGVVPAFDQYFKKTFNKLYGTNTTAPHSSFSNLNEQSIKCIYDFYTKNQKILDSIKIEVIDFNGNPIGIYYKIAKLIDMFGFVCGNEN